MAEFEDCIRFSQRLSTVVTPLVVDLLRAGQSVVMDFQANTRRRRAWFRSMFEEGQADHVLHCLQTPDALCLQRLARRNAELPEGAGPVTEALFWHVSSFFEAPRDSEGFTVVTHAS